MKTLIFTVYDTKAECYLQPFFLPTRGLALRTFTETVNDKSHNFGKYPEDYTLFVLGSYEDQNSEFLLSKAPISLGVGVEFLNPKSLPTGELK